MEIKNWHVLKFYIKFHFIIFTFVLILLSSKVQSEIGKYETYYIQISLEDNIVISESGEILKFKDDDIKIPVNLITELVGISRNLKKDDSLYIYQLNEDLIKLSCVDEGVLCINNEIYLEISRWKSQFHLNLKFDEKKMQLNIYPEVDIPYLKKYIEPEQRNNVFDTDIKVEDVFTKKLNDGVAIDQNINFSGNNNTSIDTKLSGNIYNFDSKLIFNNQYNQSINLIKKRNNEFNFLGIKATEVQLFNVDSVPGSSLFVPQNLTGVYLNNYRKSSAQFLNESFVYRREKSWQGEIYKENLLIERVDANQDGIIVFKNVFNKIGRNDFIIRLYGPQGQFEEFAETYNLREKYSQGNNLNYQIFSGESNSKRLNILRLEQIIFPRYILGGTFLEKKTRNSNLYAFTLDHSFLFNKINFDLTSSFQSKGNNLIQAEFNTVTFLGDFKLKSERNNSFVKFDQSQPNVRKNKVEASLFLNSIYGLKSRLLLYDYGISRRDTYASFLGNYNINKINLNTEIVQMLNDKKNYFIQTFRYFLRSSYFQTELKLNNHLALNNVLNLINIDFDNMFNAYLNSSYDLIERKANVNLGVNYIFDLFKLNISTSFVDNSISYSSGLFYSMVFARDKFNSLSSKPVENNSIVKIISFEDSNYNNSYDTGESLIQDVSFKIIDTKYTTNISGEVYIDGLPSYSQVSIRPELNSVEDIYLYPTFLSKNIFIRPAMINTIYFPFGRFYSISLRRFQNKNFKLLNEFDEVLASGKIDSSDYILEKIKPGKYLMLIGEGDTKQVFQFNVVDQDIDLFP